MASNFIAKEVLIKKKKNPVKRLWHIISFFYITRNTLGNIYDTTPCRKIGTIRLAFFCAYTIRLWLCRWCNGKRLRMKKWLTEFENLCLLHSVHTKEIPGKYRNNSIHPYLWFIACLVGIYKVFWQPVEDKKNSKL